MKRRKTMLDLLIILYLGYMLGFSALIIYFMETDG